MKRILYSLSAILVLMFATLSTIPALAAEAPTTNNSPGSSGLTIDPRKNIDMNPGQTINDKLMIGNLSQTANLDLSLRVVDFTFYNNSGTPELMLAQNAPQTAWSLKPFIKLQSTVLVGAGKTVEVPYSITIPKNQGAGSYYSAIMYSANSGGSGVVGLNASGASLIFVNVSGQVHENMTLQKFGAWEPGKSADSGSYKFFTTAMPQQMAYTLKNNGNVAEAPTGTITIKYMFGGKPITVSNINVNSSLALIGQSRLFSTCIVTATQTVLINGVPTSSNVCGKTNLKPGLYTAELEAFYGQNGNPTQEVSGTASFWYLPWWFVISVIVIILIIAFIIWRLVRKIRRKFYGVQHKKA